MNKVRLMVLPVILVLFGASVWAQNPPSDDSSADAQRLMLARQRAMGGRAGMYPPAMDKQKIEKFVQSLLEIGLTYEMLEKPTIVSTDDGVIVAYGNTLRKYDKDLNVVKEIDLDVDVDGMQALASKFARKYTASFMDLMDPTASPSGPSPSDTSSASSGTTASGTDKSYDQREDEIKNEIDQMK